MGLLGNKLLQRYSVPFKVLSCKGVDMSTWDTYPAEGSGHTTEPHRATEPHPTWDQLMTQALAISAKLATVDGDVPVAALLVDKQGQIVATGHNLREINHDPTAHAEIVAIRQAAAAKQDWRLEDLTLIVTLEPCLMCAAAISFSSILKSRLEACA